MQYVEWTKKIGFGVECREQSRERNRVGEVSHRQLGKKVVRKGKAEQNASSERSQALLGSGLRG